MSIALVQFPQPSVTSISQHCHGILPLEPAKYVMVTYNIQIMYVRQEDE